MIDPIELHSFVDGELNAERESAISAALEKSSSDRNEVETIRLLKSMLADKSVPLDSKESWKACVGRLNEIDKARRVEHIVSRYAPALCGAFFVCIVLAGLVTRHHDGNSLTTKNLARLVGSLPNSHATNDGTTDHWYREMIKQSKLSTPDHLVVRTQSAGQIEGVQVNDYQARDENGDLEILDIHAHIDFEGMTPMPENPDVEVGTFKSRNCVARILGSETIMVIADRSYEDLAKVFSRLKIK